MNKHLVIAGGGTGGHIFPGIAVAEAWRAAGGKVTFVGTAAGQESDVVPKHGFDLHLLKVGRLKGAGAAQKIKTILGLPPAILQARTLLKNLKADIVLGIGGYASGPVTLAARLLGRPTAITDQNVQPGMTNRVLGKLVKRVFVSFAESEQFFPKHKLMLAGNPIRSQIQPAPYQAPNEQLSIFVFGGSQGARVLNEQFLGALKLLQDLWPKLNIVHQAGKADIDSVRNFYQEHAIPAETQTFFTDMNDRYRNAHIVICRAGAGTLTELALAGRPAILVPYPFAADDHQTKNAAVFANANAAWLVPQSQLSPAFLADKLRGFLNNPQDLVTHAANMARLAKPDGAKTIVQELARMAST